MPSKSIASKHHIENVSLHESLPCITQRLPTYLRHNPYRLANKLIAHLSTCLILDLSNVDCIGAIVNTRWQTCVVSMLIVNAMIAYFLPLYRQRI